MAQPQENAMAKDLKDSPEWVVIADDWVDIDDTMDADDDDDFDQAKSKKELPDHVTSKNELPDHVTSSVIAEDENTSGPQVLTSYVDVPEEIVKFFVGKDVVMDLQIVSGAMIQVTKACDVDAKYRPVRLIGNSENVEKAEKLIKAVVALADAGGSALLRKHDCDTSDYGTKYGHNQKKETYQSPNILHRPEESWGPWGPFQFDRKRSHKWAHGISPPSPFFGTPTGGRCCSSRARPFQS